MGKYTSSVEDHLILPARVRLLREDERAFASRGEIAPVPVSIRLIVDTGSKRTTLIPSIIRHLQPTPDREVHQVTPTGRVSTNLFWVCLEFPEAGLTSFPEILVARHPMPPMLRQFHGLLGRDMLQHHESFEYLGRHAYFTLRDSPGWFGWLRRRL
jgi:hypothetical protein